MRGNSRGIYDSLYDFPYLYSSKTLKGYVSNAKNEDEYEAIQQYMRRFNIYDNKEYKGYLSVTRSIQKELYEEQPINWNDLCKDYTPVVQYDGSITFSKKPKYMEGF